MRIFNVEFLVSVDTKYGEQVYVCGSIPALGNWNPYDSLKLYTNQKLYPKWQSRDSLPIKQKTQIEFKLLILNKQKTQYRWQNLPQNQNRYICVYCHCSVQFSFSQENLTIRGGQPYSLGKTRKKTIDIINELDSESSSNKQDWKQLEREDDKDKNYFYLSNLENLRAIIQSHKQSDICLYNKLYSRVYTYQYPRQLSNQNQNSPFYSIIIHSQQNQFFEQKQFQIISTDSTQGYGINKKKHQAYHLRDNNTKECLNELKKWQKQALLNNRGIITIAIDLKTNQIELLQLILEAGIRSRYVIYLSQNVNLQIFKLIQNINIVVLEKYQQLTQTLQKLPQMGFNPKLIKPNLYSIYHHHYQETFVYCSDKKYQMNKDQNENVDIYKLLKIHTEIILDNFICEIINNYHFRYNNQVKIIILSVDQLKVLSQKIIQQLIQLSTLKLYQIYIFHQVPNQALYTILPTQPNNTLLAINKSGQIYSTRQLCTSIYQTFSLSKNKLHQYYQQLIQHINDKQHCNIKLTQYDTLICKFTNDQFGKQIKQFIPSFIQQKNKNSLHKLLMIQGSNANQVQIKPLWLTMGFYIKAILNRHFNNEENNRAAIFAIDYCSGQQTLNLVERALEDHIDEVYYKGLVCYGSQKPFCNITKPIISENGLQRLFDLMINLQKKNQSEAKKYRSMYYSP